MSDNQLVETFLQLEELELNLFRSTHLVPGKKEGSRVYGGQVMGQALMAAAKTVPDEFHPHSFHCYFIFA
uniref:Acyl-CoA thioesterase II n=1 Tax=Plectus sambesii TaxID=2011161 RepID=A0A914WLF3_9BILA